MGYGVPVACGCNYKIPGLKSLPKPKKDKNDKNGDVKVDKRDRTIKVKDADKTTKNKTQASTSKSSDLAGSSNKNSKTKDSQIDKNKGSDTDHETDQPKRIDDRLLDTPDANLMDFSEGVTSANEQPNLSQLNKTTGDSTVPDLNKNKTPGDTSVTTIKISKTPGDTPVTTAGASTEAHQDSDSSSVVTMDTEISEKPEQVELDAPLHTFTAAEDTTA